MLVINLDKASIKSNSPSYVSPSIKNDSWLKAFNIYYSLLTVYFSFTTHYQL
jgi:hypothetical protein